MQSAHSDMSLFVASHCRDRRASSKTTVTDAAWLDFMRLVVHKPLENELKLLLDKYKTVRMTSSHP